MSNYEKKKISSMGLLFDENNFPQDFENLHNFLISIVREEENYSDSVKSNVSQNHMMIETPYKRVFEKGIPKIPLDVALNVHILDKDGNCSPEQFYTRVFSVI